MGVAMSGKIRKHASLHGALFGLLLLFGCDAGLFVPDVDGRYPSLRVYANLASTTVTGLSVEVASSDIDPPLVFNIPISNGAASGTVQVPTGSDRQFTLRAYDAGGIETHRGSATATIRDGSNPPLEVTLMPLQGEREIDATLGSIIVVLTPSMDTIVVGDSLQLSAAVIDSVGEAVPDAAVHWATLDPGIATVDSRGMVFGGAAGDATIVGTYGTVGSSSVMTITESTPSGNPERVSDLAAAAATTNSITLEWTEVDDGAGGPASYAVRYGSPTISWGDAFETEVSVAGTSVGATATHTFEGLGSGTDYEFQLVSYRGTLGEAVTFGDLSNVAAGSTEAVEPGEPASVTVTPPSTTINGVGATTQLTAEARDSEGNIIPDATFEWTSEDSGIATVSQEGLVTSTAIGTTFITAALLCGSSACGGSLTDNSEITVGERSERYPNEPAGYTTWFEHDWQTFPPGDASRVPASGAGLIRSSSDNFEIVDDPTAPHGRGKSLRHEQSAGQNSGNSGGTFNLFHPKSDDSLTREDQVQLRHVYLSYWVYFEPDPTTGDWQFGNTHMRTFWWNRFYEGGAGTFNWSLKSPSSPLDQREDHFRGPRTWFYPTDDGSPSHSSLEIAVDEEFPIGVWYHIEQLIETEGKFGDGSAGVNDARVRFWVNGELKLDVIEQVFLRNPLANVHFAMVFLGNNEEHAERSQSDFVRFGDIYISGEIH